MLLENGKTVREDMVALPLEEDPKVWVQTERGRGIVSGLERKLEGFDVSDKQLSLARQSSATWRNREYFGA